MCMTIGIYNKCIIKLEIKSCTYFEQGKLRNVNFGICRIVFSHLLSMVNNIGPLFVVIKTRRKFNSKPLISNDKD
jgi:hypothetical protein